MQIFKSHANQMSSQAAIAAKTLAHAGDVDYAALTGGNLAVSTALVAVSYPSELAAGWGNPDAGLATTVNDLQRPLGVELANALVINLRSGQRVNNHEVLAVQNNLWSQPNTPDQNRDGSNQQKISNQTFTANRVENRLNQIEGVKKQGHRTPNQVALWAIGDYFVHDSIFAGKSLDRKNISK